MNFEKYTEKYINKAKQVNLADNIITENLNYAKKLFDNGYPIIYDQMHFCKLVGYKYEFILGITNATDLYYRKFKIHQRNGKIRHISEPMPSLKEIQQWIKDSILDKVELTPYAKAYRKGYSIKDNAKYHRNRDAVISLDIKNFFDNIKIKRVIRVFKECGYSNEVAVLLSKLCCYKERLPQGAPTSPVISNIIMNNIDTELATFAKCNELRFTRYADDITFSGNVDSDSSKMIIKRVDNIMQRHRLYLNEKNREFYINISVKSLQE